MVQTVSIDSRIPGDVEVLPEDGRGLTDEELTALALAADPNDPLDETAVPWSPYETGPDGPLPMWYMPPAMARAVPRGWRTPVVVAIIAAFLLIDVLGLCITYGQLVAA
ncbi:MAG: hypothetical protein J2P57_06785 [Acidimicrobiaceae bacterium]|nr:hypothetical protein [Acidimicrobiaceae bacterium]